MSFKDTMKVPSPERPDNVENSEMTGNVRLVFETSGHFNNRCVFYTMSLIVTHNNRQKCSLPQVRSYMRLSHLASVRDMQQL